MIEIRVPDAAHSSQTVSLQGVDYILEFDYNKREEAWRITIKDVFGEPILYGLKVLPDTAVNGSYQVENFSGYLFCSRNSGDAQRVVRDNFGIDKDFSLMYFTEEEVVEAVNE